ncbi:hypothetical protein D2B33_17795 [Bacillus paralicheniformis]|jgi:hypothetical protein|nr:hypothetical protein BaLi_c05340 [Bacillus paralicheniformis ATCC 9945a]KUL16657.1 hypothetical protein LI6934_14520 [Bacillus licheniformis LMG 6934]OCI04792.1 hypothetical protein BBP22_11880 [Bacillus paralicheniformis]QFY40119.1 hypothetical protein D2B33_17795 [Bacillus paralicheniformis]GIN54876.1 hypothetical protein J36TS2_37700 [Bacillus paralicheniformis]
MRGRAFVVLYQKFHGVYFQLGTIDADLLRNSNDRLWQRIDLFARINMIIETASAFAGAVFDLPKRLRFENSLTYRLEERKWTFSHLRYY